jgi:hypothetical protein
VRARPCALLCCGCCRVSGTEPAALRLANTGRVRDELTNYLHPPAHTTYLLSNGAFHTFCACDMHCCLVRVLTTSAIFFQFLGHCFMPSTKRRCSCSVQFGSSLAQADSAERLLLLLLLLCYLALPHLLCMRYALLFSACLDHLRYLLPVPGPLTASCLPRRGGALAPSSAKSFLLHRSRSSAPPFS